MSCNNIINYNTTGSIDNSSFYIITGATGSASTVITNGWNYYPLRTYHPDYYYPNYTYPFQNTIDVYPLTVDLKRVQEFAESSALKKWIEFLGEFSVTTKKQKISKALWIFTKEMVKENKIKDEKFLDELQNDISNNKFKLSFCKKIECWDINKKEIAHVCGKKK